MPHLDIKVHSTHYLDALRSILGDPLWVTSIHGRYPGQEPVVGETVTKTVLEYEDGHQALVATNHYNEHGEPYAEFRILGTEGTLQGTIGLMYDYPNGRPDTLALYREGKEVQAFEFDTMWLPDAFLGPMSDLMDAVATGREPRTSGRDNLRTLALVLGSYRSAEERRSIRVAEVLEDRCRCQVGVADGPFAARLAARTVRTVDDPLAKEMVESQQLSLDAMTNLLNSLLDISRLDAGAIERAVRDGLAAAP